MSGFPWTSLIIAVVPAAGVLAGAALTGRQNSEAGRISELKADYAAFVKAAIVLLEHLQRLEQSEISYDPQSSEITVIPELVSAVQLTRAVVDLAGSFGAIQAASRVAAAASRSAAAPGRTGELQIALDLFLRTVRSEVGGESHPGPKWIIQRAMQRWRARRLPDVLD